MPFNRIFGIKTQNELKETQDKVKLVVNIASIVLVWFKGDSGKAFGRTKIQM
jgi:hypothetical protein